MSGRLFTPDGPAVSPMERRQRLAEARDAQLSLSLSGDTAAMEDGAAWAEAAAPFGVWFDENPAGTPTLAQWKAARAEAVELAEIRCPDGTEWSIRYTDYAPTLGQLLSTTTGAPLLEVERTDDGNQWTATLLDRHGDPKGSPVVRYAAAAAVWSRWLR